MTLLVVLLVGPVVLGLCFAGCLAARRSRTQPKPLPPEPPPYWRVEKKAIGNEMVAFTLVARGRPFDAPRSIEVGQAPIDDEDKFEELEALAQARAESFQAKGVTA